MNLTDLTQGYLHEFLRSIHRLLYIWMCLWLKFQVILIGNWVKRPTPPFQGSKKFGFKNGVYEYPKKKGLTQGI